MFGECCGEFVHRVAWDGDAGWIGWIVEDDCFCFGCDELFELGWIWDEVGFCCVEIDGCCAGECDERFVAGVDGCGYDDLVSLFENRAEYGVHCFAGAGCDDDFGLRIVGEAVFIGEEGGYGLPEFEESGVM